MHSFFAPLSLFLFAAPSFAAITCLKPGATATARWTNSAGKTCTWTGVVGSNFGTNSVNGGEWVNQYLIEDMLAALNALYQSLAIVAMADAGLGAAVPPLVTFGESRQLQTELERSQHLVWIGHRTASAMIYARGSIMHLEVQGKSTIINTPSTRLPAIF
jgi:hypothetical protein